MTELFIPVKFEDAEQVKVTAAITLKFEELPVHELADISEAVEVEISAALRAALVEND